MDRNAINRSDLARRELQKPIPHQFYVQKKIDRLPRHFNPLLVRKWLQASLPYAWKLKLMQQRKCRTNLQKRAVVMETDEKALTLMQ